MRLHSLTLKLLSIVILLGFLAAAVISYERFHVEANDQTVEMVYDYDDIIARAPLEGKTAGELFDLYRTNGVTSLALYDDTPSKILGRGDALIFRGADMMARTGNDPAVSADRIYIQPSSHEDGEAFFEDFKKNLTLRMDSRHVREISIGGVRTLEVEADWMKFLEMPVGIFPTRVKEAEASGFYLVLRPLNTEKQSSEILKEFLRAVDASPKVSAVLFTGKEAFGYKSQADAFRDAMKERHIPIVLIEAQTQLGFENQAGALDMVKTSDYNTVRLYAMSKDELIKITPAEASARFYISDIERNIRMNLFPSYKYPLDGKSLSETNAGYIAQTRDRLAEHGFSTGRASQMEPYFPSRPLRAAAMAGALSIAVMALLFVLPCAEKWVWPIWGAGLLATQGLYWGTSSLLPVQLLALAVEIGTPVVIVSFFLWYCLSKKKEAEQKKSWGKVFAEGAAVLWAGGLTALCGGIFVSALLGDIRFFLEIEIFRGVKATFVLPLVLVTLVYIQHFPFFGKPVTNDREFAGFIKKFCSLPIRLGVLMGLGVLAFAAFMFVGRSGNNMAPVPAFEVALRRFLEDTMYARPREKEFLLGHPAVFLAVASLYQKWPQLLHYFLIIAVTIGQGSMVETFAHMRSPFILSFIRGLDGLAAGTAAGLLALIGAVILLRLTKFFGERYGKV